MKENNTMHINNLAQKVVKGYIIKLNIMPDWYIQFYRT